MNLSYISPQTVILYLSVWLVSIVFAFVADRYKNSNRGKTGVGFWVWYSLSFAPLYLLLYFSACGADYESYNRVFEVADNFREVFGFNGEEYGFTTYVYLIRLFTKDVNTYNAILGLTFLIPIYLTFYKLRNKLHIGWAILCFVSVYYFQYLDLKRIYIAGAFVFSATPYWLNKQYGKTILLAALAASFHVSSFLIMLPIIADIISKDKFKLRSVLTFAIIGITLLITFRSVLSGVNLGERHEEYTLHSTASLGITQFAYYLPIIIILISLYKDCSGERFYKLAFFELLFLFGLALFSYYFAMVGRAFVHYMLPIVSFSTLVLYDNSKEKLVARNKQSFLLKLFIVLYCGFRLYMYFWEYLILDQISPYITIYGDIY